MVDEITSFNKEVIHYVCNVHHNIREDFLAICKLTKVTGWVRATSVLNDRYQLGWTLKMFEDGDMMKHPICPVSGLNC